MTTKQEDRIWELYPETLDKIAAHLDMLNSVDDIEFDIDLKQWVTEDDENFDEIVVIPESEREQRSMGWGFGWIIPSDIEDVYCLAPYDPPYSDFTLNAGQLRTIALMIRKVDELESEINLESMEHGPIMGFTSRFDVVFNGDSESVVGSLVDTVGGAFSFSYRKP